MDSSDDVWSDLILQESLGKPEPRLTLMIPIKRGAELSRMKKACEIAAAILGVVRTHCRAGVTTFDLDDLAHQEMKRVGAESACYGYQLAGRRFPGHICVSVNEEVVHGIGSVRRILRDGDIVSLDVVVRVEGFVGDTATTLPIGVISPGHERLLRVTEEALTLGIRQALVGNRVGDISNAIQTYVESNGYNVVREMVGHGVGRKMHEEPQIPNFGRPRSGALIQAGMTLAIEPMVNLGSGKTRVQPDGWTVVAADGLPSAHFEHTVLTTPSGPEVLTDPCRLSPRSAPPLEAAPSEVPFSKHS